MVRRLLVALVVLAGLLALGDVLVKDGVQAAIAARIESKSPGSHATVHISSFPFVGRLAASGTVPSLRADVTGLRVGDLEFDQIDLQVTDLRVERSQLLHGRVTPVSIRSGSVIAEISQSSLDADVHLPVTLGQGTVGALGVNVAASATVSGDKVSVELIHNLSFTLTIPLLDVLPCVGAASIVPGELRLSCHFTTLPGVLAGASFTP